MIDCLLFKMNMKSIACCSVIPYILMVTSIIINELKNEINHGKT